MILGNLQQSARIEALHPAFKQAFDYIKSHDLLNTPPGRIELDGDNLFINNSLVETPKAQDEQVLEAHRQYLDIHVLLEGQERVGWKAIEDCAAATKEYDQTEDYMLFAEPATTYIDMLPGQFLIVYPEDAHAPIISDKPIRKLVIKVKL